MSNAKLQLIKRAVIGGYVKADVTGTGDWEVGKIILTNHTNIIFSPASGGEQISVVRSAAYKATREEYEEAFSAVQGGESADSAPEGQGEVSPSADDIPEDDHSNTIRADLSHYVVGGDDGRTVTITNRKTVDIDDEVAQTLRAKVIDEVYEIVAEKLGEHGITEIGPKKNRTSATYSGLMDRYGHLNLGMQRMNLGNLLRRCMQKDD